ncbi:signal peptide peptidase SppA [Maricaulaceae bacterium MS644]
MSDVRNESVPAAIWRWIGLVQHGILRVFGLILIFIVLLSLSGAFSGDGDEFKLADNGVLKFEPEGAIVEETVQVSPGDAFTAALLGGGQANQILLRDVIEGLRIAAADEDVTALLVRFDGLTGATPAALHAIAAEMAAFRASGKQIVSYADAYFNGSWFLSAQADEVYLHEMGAADVSGFASFRTYFAGLLERLNVTVNVYRVGTFKSALEPFLGNEMSEAAEEANRLVFGEIWESYKAVAGEARGIAPGAIQAYGDELPRLMADAGGDAAAVALDTGLVDHLVGRGEYMTLLGDRFGLDEDNAAVQASDFLEYVEANRPDAPRGNGDRIAVIYAVGTIIDGEADGGAIGGDIHARLIRQARLDENVRAIVLRIDSGGGSAFASELIREELEMARLEGKPVIASMGGVAASGGYWIAAPANRIIAEPTTITGSIGIFGFIPTFENALAEIGVTEDGFGTTAMARQPSFTGGVTSEWDSVLQSGIEHGYQQFIGLVAEARGMTLEQVDAVAQGRIWTGAQALERGLVDELGDYDDAIRIAAEMAGIEDYQVVVVKEETDPLKELLEALGADAAAHVAGPNGLFGTGLFAQAARSAAGELQAINMMNDPRGLYAACLTCDAYRQVQ